MNDLMKAELNPTTEGSSSSVVEAAAIRTVSSRFRNLREKAGSVARMVAQRTGLTGTVLALLISSGCSNVERQSTPIPVESTPISTSIVENVKAPEKQVLTDVEFVGGLLKNYLDLDADPQLTKLNDLNYLGSQLSKSIRVESDSKQVPLGTFNPDSDYDRSDIEYRIPSVNMSITVQERKGEGVVGELIGFNIDKEGNIVVGGDSRLSNNEPLPARDEVDKLVLAATRNAAKFLRNKPDKWSTDPDANNWEMSAARGMISNVSLPNGKNIKYGVAGTGEQPLDISAFITTGK